MKKRSKLFLLVAGIIFSVGVIVCLIGVSVAASTGEQIYAAKIGDERGYTYDFGDGNIDKIKIQVDEAEVNIFGESERSYIEIINFNENLCSYSANNAMITFKEASEVNDITGVWESGLSFKGIRYILRPVPADRKKIVNIYLEKKEHVKAFDIQVTSGDVNVQSVNTLTDYNVTIESGDISFTDVITESGIDIVATGKNVTDIKFSRVNTDTFELEAKRAKFKGEGFSSDTCSMNVAAGSAVFSFVPKNVNYEVEIYTKGKLTVDDVICRDRYVYPKSEDTPTTDPSGDSEERPPSRLAISGQDFSVTVDTPASEIVTQDIITE